MKFALPVLLVLFFAIPRAAGQDLESLLPLVVALDSTDAAADDPAWSSIARTIDSWSQPDRLLASRLAEIAEPPAEPARKTTAGQKVRMSLSIASALLPLAGTGLLMAGRRDEAAALALAGSSLAGITGLLSIRQQIKAAAPSSAGSDSPADLTSFRVEFQLAAALLGPEARLSGDRVGVASRIRDLRAFHEVGLTRARAALAAAPPEFAPDREPLVADLKAGDSRWAEAWPILERIEQATNNPRTP